MKIELTIPGEPQGKQRVRWAPKGTYTPKKTVNYETYIKELFVIKYPDFILLEGPLRIRLLICYTIAPSASQKRQRMMESGEILPTKIPDYDNVAKTVSDALEGIAYKNDSYICKAEIDKFYSRRPRLEIRLEEMK